MNSLSLALPATARHAAFGKRTAFGKIALNEARLTWRRPIGLIGAVGIPMVLLVIFGELPTFQQQAASFGGITPFDAYVPILIVFAVAMLALLGVPIPLTTYRELGVLRRLSTTPMPPSWLLTAQGLVQLCVAVTAVVAIVVTSITVFGAPVPANPGGLVLSVLLAAGGLFPIGLMIAAIARTASAANVIGRLVFFPMLFFAGLWLPRALMPGVLLDISNYTPLGAAVQAIQDSMLQGFPPAAPLLVLMGYAATFGFLAKRFFRWE
jgi:ABC-2 type transport system permease protein